MKLERFVFCQYCDDVRHEVDGKISLIGVYSGGLQVHGQPPAAIAKLFVVCHVGTPKEKPFEKLKIRVLHDAKELLSADAPTESLAESAQRLQSPDGRGYMFTLAFPLPPIQVEKDGELSVQLETEAGSTVANKLQIKIAAPAPREAKGFRIET